MDAITGSGAASFPIGELSRLTAVDIETIRYYERILILPTPSRTEGGRRVYGPDQVQKLHFIRRSRELGFTLDEIRTLLKLAEGIHPCGEVKAAAEAHMKDIRLKIADLRRMERTLARTAKMCQGAGAANCPILQVLSIGPAACSTTRAAPSK
jgi:MerR family mercuric resistance operon transcriptional regulator